MFEIGAVVVGAIFAGLQALTLFILKDLRERVMRLEDRHMGTVAGD